MNYFEIQAIYMGNNTVSVKELNKVLNNEKLSSIFSDVDIVFVAGVFLWYMQNKDNWKKIPRFFNLTENDNAWNHSHYFKQIEDLYKIKHYQIFDNFPNANNSNANPVSNFFAPPIYITNKSIDYFFDTKISHKRIEHIKVKYKSLFDLLDFVDKSYSTYKNSTKKFENFATEMQQRLETVSPIFVFVFIVTCKRLAKKENRTFENTKNYLEKIWLFTIRYTNGLHELAKNIVEHSGQGENDGQGMITIRAYSGTNIDNEKIKVLETHVFDYGKKGIYETLKQNTKSNKTLKDDDVYTQDFNTLNNAQNKYTIKDFIEPIDNQKFLLQQFYREMAHYGLMHFKDLIEQYEGKIIASSVREDNENKREVYVFSKNSITEEEIIECDITKGTSYYFEMPFIPSLFERQSKISHELSNQLTASALTNLQKFELVEYTVVQSLQHEKDKKYIINFKISDSFKNIGNFKIDTREKENCVCNDIIGKLDSPYITKVDNICIAFDFEGVGLNKSNLLRILARLSRERLSNFIVYNIDCKEFIGLVKDNEQWFEKVKDKWNYIENKKIDTSYWLKNKSILFYTKYEKVQKNEIEGKQEEDEKLLSKDYFYFADLLYGETSKTFNSINKIISNTFPNTTFINKDKEFDIDNNFLIPNKLQEKYFYGTSKYLLPFDTLFKCKEDKTNEEKELFFFNIKTILQNELLVKESYQNIAEYVDSFDGYRIKQTHFKIGNKVHSTDFYYAKRLFQNSFYTTRLAMHLAKQINKEINNPNIKIAIAGYEIYSELILSLTNKFLRDIYNYHNVSHFIAQSEDDKMSFLPKDVFNDYLKDCKNCKTIIAVPIAATGNTTKKIKSEIQKRYYKRYKEEIENNIFILCNVLLAQDPDPKFDSIKNNNDNHLPMISLHAKWHNLKDCILCYGGINEEEKPIQTKPLFDTDKSSLTPSLIFGNPIGQTKLERGQIGSNVKFDDLIFENSIKYQSVARNDNYRIYDVDSDIFIRDNKDKIEDWLKNTVKSYLENSCSLISTDKVIIVAPCHESNSKFINLINENVFSSSAIIIHHQNGVDFVENFSLLYGNYLTGENTKVFYVDDSLISGKHFFELFDMISEVNENPQPLTASILLNDQAVPFIHDRAVRWSKNYFAFATYNQPPTLNMLEKRPLEYEQKRYELLQESTLHDILREHFHKKATKLNPEKRHTEENETPEKIIRRLKMFEATHKIYDYFTKKNNNIPDLTNEVERGKFVDFKLKHGECIDFNETDTNKKALFKVLSQYPFILYKDLRTSTFNWHKKLLEELNNNYEQEFTIETNNLDYEFSTFKFRLRRAAFLGNYQVLEVDFLNKLLLWFFKIDLYFNEKQKKNTQYSEYEDQNEEKRCQILDNERDDREKLKRKEDNLRDFPIFVLGNYIEMIQKNPWVAYKIMKNINHNPEFLYQLKKSNQGKQFLNMLQIETASTIDDFTKMLNKEYRIKWRNMYKDTEQKDNQYKLYTFTDKIVDFFLQTPKLLKTNKYELVKETFLDNSDDWIKEDTPFVNYLWIKQLLYADSIDKEPHIKIDYQNKIDAIINKMIGFFPDKEKVQAFFIVTDGQQKPYVLSPQNNSILNEFTDEFENNKSLENIIERLIMEIKQIKNRTIDFAEKLKELNKKEEEQKILVTKTLIDFLRGIPCSIGNATETTAEFIFESKKGKNIYTDEDITIEFIPSEYRWLFLIRISKLKEYKDDNCTEFEAQGLLGFYSTEDLSENILFKQLLMLLRKDMSAFINKHHKNDEFSELIQQRGKANYTFTLNHGIDDYYTSKDINMKAVRDDPNYIEYLDYFFDYLINKTWLLSTLHLPKEEIEEDNIEIIKIVQAFKREYSKIFYLKIANCKSITKEQCSNHIDFNTKCINIKDLREIVSLPKDFYKEIVFELLYNIKKHVIERHFDNKIVYQNQPLKIDLKIEKINGVLYLSVENNHFYDSGEIAGYVHGLSLIEKVLFKHNNLKKLKIEKSADTNKFKVFIPLKEIKRR